MGRSRGNSRKQKKLNVLKRKVLDVERAERMKKFQMARHVMNTVRPEPTDKPSGNNWREYVMYLNSKSKRSNPLASRFKPQKSKKEKTMQVEESEQAAPDSAAMADE